MKRRLPVITAVLLSVVLIQALPVNAAPPLLYKDPARQSPVRGEPDDLLMIAGSGFAASDTVVYQRLTDTTQPLVHPSSIPSTSTADLGVAPIVSTANIPDSLTVKLPSVMLSLRSYALWVVANGADWSQGVKINDARPLWITPEVAYRMAALAGLPRQLKVVGRNLQAQPSLTTKVRLRGPKTYTLNALDLGDPATAIEHYVARVNLPNNVQVGTYLVDVQRDGVSWVTLQGQSLTVLADPAAGTSFNVSSCANPPVLPCAANDGVDDTACVVCAVNAAIAAGGGKVVFGTGQWDLIDSTTAGVDPDHGIILPVGVSLVGTSATATTVMKAAGWNFRNFQLIQVPVFTVQGRNTISKIRFEDARSYFPTDYTDPFFQLGKRPWYPNPGPSPVEEVIFTQNVFARPFMAIASAGLPLRHLYITSNEFGAYYLAFSPGGNSLLPNIKFRLDDSIIAYNTFKPGGYLAPCIHQGTLATEIGAATRLDFSNNVADGRATDYLAGSIPGWRAAFFWHMSNNHEMMLVSENTATCTGDKAGDGEAFAYDGNQNTFGFKIAKDVTLASPTTVEVSMADGFPLETTQNGVPVPADYYNQHWIQVANGLGLGQARKITAYNVDSVNQRVTFTVSPAWDVVPQQGSSKITVAREFWQVYTVDNTVDIRGCTKNNQNGLNRMGYIGFTGMTSDATVEGNVQYESGGIYLSHQYSIDDTANGFFWTDSFGYFVELRANTLNDETLYDSACSWAGIQLWHGAASASSEPMPPSPVVLGYGVSVARNTVSHADGIRGGAIVFADTWVEPAGSRMYLNTLIHHNSISNLPATTLVATSTDACSGPFNCGDVPVRGVGIHIKLPLNYYTVLYQNTFTSVPTPLIDNGTGTVQVP